MVLHVDAGDGMMHALAKYLGASGVRNGKEACEAIYLTVVVLPRLEQ